MAQVPKDAPSSNGEVQEGRPSALIDCSLEAHSYYRLFELILCVFMVRRNNDCTVIFRLRYPFFLFSMTFFGSSSWTGPVTEHAEDRLDVDRTEHPSDRDAD